MAGSQNEEESKGITLDEVVSSLKFLKDRFSRYNLANTALSLLESDLQNPARQDIATALSFLKGEIEAYDSSAAKVLRIADKIDDLQAMVYAADTAGVAMAVIQTSDKGRNVHPLVTRGYACLTGYTSEELESVPVARIVHQEDFVKFNEHYKSRMADPSVSTLCEVRIISRSRGTVYVDASLGKGKYRGKPAYVVFLWDASVRKELEKQAERANKIDFFTEGVRGVMHDLGNIAQSLSAVGMFPPDELAKNGMWSDIVAASNSISSLITKMGDFCMGKFTETAEHIDIAQIVNEAVSSMNESYRMRGITVTSKVEEGNYILVPPVDFKRVLINILGNAGDAIEDAEKGKIPGWDGRKEVKVIEQREKDKVCVTISDTGIGLEDTNKIYLPSFSTKKGRHSGLGLGIAYKILTQNSGNIDHYSAGRGKGATFYITLPYRPVRQTAKQQ